jgi:hypothetical protein
MSVHEDLERLRAALVETHNLDSIPTYTELVAGTLMTDSISFVQGRPGSCKSFLALDLAGCVATGLPWHGHVTKQGRVLYVVAEGGGGLKARVRAWEEARDELMHGVMFLPLPVQIMGPTEGPAFAALCEDLHPALIVIDTQARSSVGLNENSAQEMGHFIEQVEAIRKVTGACVLLVHHEGRAGEHMRGSTALEGAAQTVLRVVKEDAVITVSVVKQKDGEESPPMELVVKPTGASIVLEHLRRTWSNDGPKQPTSLMRKISDVLERADEPLTARSLREKVPARQENIRFALAKLIDGGYVSTEEGPRSAVFHTLLAPFRGSEAP